MKRKPVQIRVLVECTQALHRTRTPHTTYHLFKATARPSIWYSHRYRLQTIARICIYLKVFFFCCGFGLGQIVAIPIDWQFPASPLAQSTPRSFDWPPVNCVQLCINECIWPRARTQVLRILAWNVACTRHLPTLVDRVGERAGQKW